MFPARVLEPLLLIPLPFVRSLAVRLLPWGLNPTTGCSGDPPEMTTVVHIDSPAEWGRRLPWALRVAATDDELLVLTMPGQQGTRAMPLRSDQGGSAARVIPVLDRLLGEGGWQPAPLGEGAEDEASGDDKGDPPPLTCELWELDQGRLTRELLELLRRRSAQRLVFVQAGPVDPDADSSALWVDASWPGCWTAPWLTVRARWGGN